MRFSKTAQSPPSHLGVDVDRNADENRSFDSYFGQLHFEGQPRATAEPRHASNPNPLNEDASPIRAFHQTG